MSNTLKILSGLITSVFLMANATAEPNSNKQEGPKSNTSDNVTYLNTEVFETCNYFRYKDHKLENGELRASFELCSIKQNFLPNNVIQFEAEKDIYFFNQRDLFVVYFKAKYHELNGEDLEMWQKISRAIEKLNDTLRAEDAINKITAQPEQLRLN